MYNLLFVDDEERALEAIRETVNWEGLGLQVVGWCTNAITALQTLANDHVDILITDIKMPVMDGIELVSRARQMYPSIECVILSGYGEFELAQAAIKSGVRGYLLKPFQKDELEEELRRCIEAIERTSVSTEYWLTQRRTKAEETAEALSELEIDGSDRDKQKVLDIAHRFRDYTLIKDAVFLLETENQDNAEEVLRTTKALTKITDIQELINLTVQILRNYKSESSEESSVIHKMKDYTHLHYTMPGLTVSYIAEHEIHFSPKYLGRRFLKETGMKYSAYLLSIRMEKAKEYIRDTSLSTEEIVEKIGLGSNVMYFYRLFHQYTGMTYKQYRDSFHR